MLRTQGVPCRPPSSRKVCKMMFGFSGWHIWVSWNVAICHWQMSKGSCKCMIWVCLSNRQDKSRRWGHLKKMIWTLTWFAAGCLFWTWVFWCWNLCNLERSTPKDSPHQKGSSKPVILRTHNLSCFNWKFERVKLSWKFHQSNDRHRDA